MTQFSRSSLDAQIYIDLEEEKRLQQNSSE